MRVSLMASHPNLTFPSSNKDVAIAGAYSIWDPVQVGAELCDAVELPGRPLKPWQQPGGRDRPTWQWAFPLGALDQYGTTLTHHLRDVRGPGPTLAKDGRDGRDRVR